MLVMKLTKITRVIVHSQLLLHKEGFYLINYAIQSELSIFFYFRQVESVRVKPLPGKRAVYCAELVLCSVVFFSASTKSTKSTPLLILNQL